MPRRPARCYSQIDRPPYTRRKYMRGVPDPKIRLFDLGSSSEDFSTQIDLIAEEEAQIRSEALEAARIIVNRYLTQEIGRTKYNMRIRVYPHHVLRENKMMAVAGADRLQDGMRRAFGKPIGTAARVRSGQVLISVFANEEDLEIVKEALRRANHKFSPPCRIVVQ